MPETPQELYRRVQEQGLRRPPLEDWETFPFEGDMRPRELQPPVDREAPRHGEDASDCWRCLKGEEHALWSDERWIVTSTQQSNGLPVVVLLFPRGHMDIDTVPDELAPELGPMLLRVERAVFSVGEIGRVHVAAGAMGATTCTGGFWRDPRAFRS